MKKLILSAVFALACFTANAQTTAKVQEAPKKQETQQKTTSETTVIVTTQARLASPMCYRTFTGSMSCNGLNFTYTGHGFARNCEDALGAAQADAIGQASAGVCP